MLTENGDSLAAIEIPSKKDTGINGLSPSEAGVIHAQLGEIRPFPIHYGGEMYETP